MISFPELFKQWIIAGIPGIADLQPFTGDRYLFGCTGNRYPVFYLCFILRDDRDDCIPVPDKGKNSAMDWNE